MKIAKRPLPAVSKMRHGRPVHQTALKSLNQGRPSAVDRSSLTIRGVTAMNEGEALGHFVWADHKTTAQTVELLRGKRLASRFGHIGMSENGMGKKIGYGTNWRLEGESVRHDLELLEAARVSPAFGNDPVEYIMQMAEKSPEAIGESFVVRHELAWLMGDGSDEKYLYWWESTPEGYPDHDKESADRRPNDAVYQYPSIRPLAFYYIDLVNDGALTHNGLYESETLADMLAGTSSHFASEIFSLIDQLRETYGVSVDEIPRKATSLMAAYLQMRGLSRDSVSKALLENQAGGYPSSMEANMEHDNEGAGGAQGTGNDSQDTQFDLLVEAVISQLGFEDVLGVVEALSARVANLEAAVVQLADTVEELSQEGSVSGVVPSVPSRAREPRYASRLAALGAGTQDAAQAVPGTNIAKPTQRPLTSMTNGQRHNTGAARLSRYMNRGE